VAIAHEVTPPATEPTWSEQYWQADLINLKDGNQHQVQHTDARGLITNTVANTNSRPKVGNTL
jgi:hypothetical protein